MKDSTILLVVNSQGATFVQKYKVDSIYLVDLPVQLDTEQLGLQFNFEELSKLTLPFGFETELKTRENKAKGTIITIVNILLACFLVLLLIYVVILLKEKNDLNTRIRLLNDTNPSDVPLTGH